ncbi:MAG: hypothetical protein F2838_11695, partial [Actinobacteria bacterium]|nr:hypothetical protein [Actinomycetota bacterium]
MSASRSRKFHVTSARGAVAASMLTALGLLVMAAPGLATANAAESESSSSESHAADSDDSDS